MTEPIFDKPIFFITGNSRSGTTMMMRIMDNHSAVHSINEPHFFEKLWSPQDQGKTMARNEAFDLYIKLIVGQREGFFEAVDKHLAKYQQEVTEVLENFKEPFTRLGLYAHFVHREASLNGKSIPSEKTPQNVFYIKEILEFFPQARVINMIRDPRGVMLSQKRKWKRRYLGADFLTRREMLRLRINYHPITISKLWNAAINAIQPFENHESVRNVRFEDLLKSPERTIEDLCGFLQIPFEPEMLLVPHAGSSSEADQKSELGIKKTRAKGWLEKGLTAAEIAACQDICKEYMQKYAYEPIEVGSGVASKALLYATFPVKIGLALIWNLNRMRSIGDTIKRRMGR